MIANRFNPLGRNLGKTAKSYVQDGLVHQWDAIENIGYGQHDSNATIWKDLIGSNDLTCGNGVTWSENACLFAGTDSAKGGVITQGADWQGVTIEMLYTRGSTNEFSCGCMGTNMGRLALFGIRDYMKAIYLRFDATNTKVSSYPSLVTITSDGTTITVYVNGIAQTTRANSTYFFSKGVSSNLPFAIGEWQHNYNFQKGNASTVRIYNRALMSEEVAHSYAIEKERFGL